MLSKTFLAVLPRLPLLFIVDSILRGTFLDFTFGSHGMSIQPFNAGNSSEQDFFEHVAWDLSLFLVTVICLILVFTSVKFILDFYRWIAGAALIWLSYNCNRNYVQGGLAATFVDKKSSNDDMEDLPDTFLFQPLIMSFSVNLLIQSAISLVFDYVTISRILLKRTSWIIHSRYPLNIVLYLSFSLPVFMESIFVHNSVLLAISPDLSIVLPVLVLVFHLCCVVYKLSEDVIAPGASQIVRSIRDIGLDGLLMNIMERANMPWLLRSFFVSRVIYQMILSDTLQDAIFSLHVWTDTEVLKDIAQEILYNMCGTLISVISLASVVTIISGWSLSCVYKLIQANDDEESLQPVVSGFLFVLLAMQTGITATSGDIRLQLLFQNSILLVVANQHFIHNVATDLLLKAAADDTALEKHIRPLIPFVFFFTFPFFAVLPLWSYPFRLSWLLAVTVFCIELLIKSVSSIILYSISLLHIHTNVLSEDVDNLTFFIKGGCGCLEFICGIFLFLNGAYIFFYESGGFIRLFMMTVHFYCNIYQSAIRGWATYKLQVSSWEKVNELEAASQEQLDENDICSICYQEMTEAVTLKCSHIYHKNCLQKWLAIKESCPLCHEDLKRPTENDETENR